MIIQKLSQAQSILEGHVVQIECTMQEFALIHRAIGLDAELHPDPVIEAMDFQMYSWAVGDPQDDQG